MLRFRAEKPAGMNPAGVLWRLTAFPAFLTQVVPFPAADTDNRTTGIFSYESFLPPAAVKAPARKNQEKAAMMIKACVPVFCLNTV